MVVRCGEEQQSGWFRPSTLHRRLKFVFFTIHWQSTASLIKSLQSKLFIGTFLFVLRIARRFFHGRKITPFRGEILAKSITFVPSAQEVKFPLSAAPQLPVSVFIRTRRGSLEDG